MSDTEVGRGERERETETGGEKKGEAAVNKRLEA